MNDTTDSTEQMPMVPDADGYEQRVDDGRDETLLMHKDAELEAESTMDGNSADTGCAENPAHPAVGEGLHLGEFNQVGANDLALQRCLRRNNR